MAPTPMAPHEIVESLQQMPLGRAPNEAALAQPFNAGTPDGSIVIVKVKNHSATVKRRVIKTAVSYRRGGAKRALAKDMKEAGYSVETIQREAVDRDMNEYEDVVKPQVVKFKFDGKEYVVPPAKAKGEDPPAVPVPAGVWDHYMGNYERMHSTDPRVRSEEIERLSYRWGGGIPTAIMRFDEDGVHDAEGNPFGYLEFIREVIAPATMAYDSDNVRASEIAEV